MRGDEPLATRAPILVEAEPNARWSLDLGHDEFAGGRRFRVLNKPADNKSSASSEKGAPSKKSDQICNAATAFDYLRFPHSNHQPKADNQQDGGQRSA